MKKNPPKFTFAPASFVPFRDTKAVARVRRIKREEITKHRNPDFLIQVVSDAEIEFLWITDMFFRIKTAMEAGRSFVAIMPNPWPGYANLPPCSTGRASTAGSGTRLTWTNTPTSHPPSHPVSDARPGPLRPGTHESNFLAVVQKLIKQPFLTTTDLEPQLKQASEHWDWVMQHATP